MSSNNEHSMRWAEKQGYRVDVCERRKPISGGESVTVDLFGFADLIAFRVGEPAVLIQTTSRGHISDRIKKITRNPTAHLWAQAGGSILVQGWDQPGGKGSRWRHKDVWLTLKDFPI